MINIYQFILGVTALSSCTSIPSWQWRRQLVHGKYSTGMDNEHLVGGFNQTGRFNSSVELIHYVCSNNGAFYGGLLAKASWEHYYTYDPVCRFPYVNKGWYKDGDQNCDTTVIEGSKIYSQCFEDVVMDDCTITFAQSTGDGFWGMNMYDSKCLVWTCFTMLPFMISLYYLKVSEPPWCLVPRASSLLKKLTQTSS
tara:strand:+ start:63 stop:650 length:588 start_codon:yes stop_codon:yes gene_type:complete